MTGSPRWLRSRLGVRVKTALAAAAAVAVVLCVAGASLVILLDTFLRLQLEQATEEQATQLGERVAANFAATEDVKRNAIVATGKRTDLVQVVIDYTDYVEDPGRPPDIQIIGSSEPLGDSPRIVNDLAQDGQTILRTTWVTLPEGPREVLVVAQGFNFPPTQQVFTVLAAQPLEPVHKAVDTVLAMVLIGIPVLVLVAGSFTYLFAGRALRPVEAIRAQVAGMTDRDLAKRVPEPRARDEVGRLAQTMNQMLARLEGAQITQRRFVADASHELRSPLATISSGLELLASAPDPADPAGRADRESTLRTLRSETDRLGKLVDGLLLLARADERGMQPRREDVDLDEVVEAERGRPSEVGGPMPEVRAEPVRVAGDRGQLVRAVRNLVDNARRHARSRVLVSLYRDGDLAVVEVADDGPGVAPQDRERVFERFVRLDEARARADGGAGLGLAIVREVVRAHGGDVEVTESPFGGALFRLWVPAMPVEAPDVEAPDAEAVPQDAGGQEPAGGTGSAAHAGNGAAGSGGEAATLALPTGPATQELKDDRPTGPLPVLRPGASRPRPRPRPPAPRDPAPLPPTRPVPIRLGDAGSPADLNPTGPLPVVAPREEPATVPGPVPRPGPRG